VRSGNNLPKADLNGSCDPYVKVELGEKRHTTQVRYKTLQPVFDETFGFDIIDTRRHIGELLLILMDKDKISRDDELGRARVSQQDIKEILSNPVGYESEMTVTLTSSISGKQLMGHNGLATELLLTLRVGSPGDGDDKNRLVLETHLDRAAWDVFVSLDTNGNRQAEHTELRLWLKCVSKATLFTVSFVYTNVCDPFSKIAKNSCQGCALASET
jgi:hypothetical protein